MSRMLSQRQRTRLQIIQEKVEYEIRSRVEAGESIREDGFFEQLNDRSDAAEVAEGAYLAAASEHEERKIPIIANLLSAFAFDPSLDREDCNQLIRLAETLSYRQMCLIHLFGPECQQTYSLRKDVIVNPWPLTLEPSIQGALIEVFELHQLLLVQQVDEWDPQTTDEINELSQIAPGRTIAVGNIPSLIDFHGKLLLEIPRSAIDALAARLT